MSKQPAIQHDSGVLAVLHRTAGSWRVIVAQTSDGPPRLLDSEDVPADAGAALASVLDRHRVGRVIRVLPASSVICRTCTLPNAEPEQLEQAMHLQAEAHLMSSVPEHRLAMTVLPASPGETNRTGLILTWPEQAESDGGDLVSESDSEDDPRPVTFAPDVAALAALMNGHRPTSPLVALDADRGSIALGITHANGAVFRGTREHAIGTTEWSRCVGRILGETALSVGHTAAFIEGVSRDLVNRVATNGTSGSTLVVPAEIVADARSRLRDAPDDEQWWSRFGVAAGVLLASDGPLSSLAGLKEAPVIATPSRLEAVLDRLARPRTAAITVAVCIVLLGLAPLLASGLRYGVLRVRHSEIDAQERAVERAKSKIAMYRALDTNAWSMTKIMSDLVSNTPEGIELDVLRLQASDQSFSLSGVAKPDDGMSATEVVAFMQGQLQETGIFQDITLKWGDANAYGHYEFDLSAKVRKPHRRFEYDVARDYGNWSLADRRAGNAPPDGADGATASMVALSNTDDVNTDDRARPAAKTLNGRTPTGKTPTGKTPSRTSPKVDRGRAPVNERPENVARPSKPGGRPDRTTDRPRLPRKQGGDDGALRRSDTDERGLEGGLPPDMIPEPLTQAQIDEMSVEEVKSQLIDVAKAKNRVNREENPELYDRLQQEFQALMKRRREDS